MGNFKNSTVKKRGDKVGFFYKPMKFYTLIGTIQKCETSILIPVLIYCTTLDSCS
jgi:hypothetical protein